MKGRALYLQEFGDNSSDACAEKGNRAGEDSGAKVL